MNSFVERFNSFPLGQRVLFLFLLMILVLIGSYALMYPPMQDAIQGQKQELAKLERQKQKLAQLKANKAEVVAKLGQLNNRLLIAQEKLPVTAEVPSLLQRIHNQAKTAGLEIDKFQREKDEPKSYYIEIPVQMQLVGTYDELANFFYYIGRMTRIVNVKGISLVHQKPSGGASDSGELKVEALATTFMYRSDISKKKNKKPRKRPKKKKK